MGLHHVLRPMPELTTIADARSNYAVFQAHLSHENDNLNQRLFWYLFSQSLLFGAYAATLNATEKPRSALLAGQQDFLVWVVPVVALLISALLYPMIIISIRHMSGMRRQFERQATDQDISDLPPIHGTTVLRRIGDFGYLTIPIVLAGAWLVLLARLALMVG